MKFLVGLGLILGIIIAAAAVIVTLWVQANWETIVQTLTTIGIALIAIIIVVLVWANQDDSRGGRL